MRVTWTQYLALLLSLLCARQSESFRVVSLQQHTSPVWFRNRRQQQSQSCSALLLPKSLTRLLQSSSSSSRYYDDDSSSPDDGSLQKQPQKPIDPLIAETSRSLKRVSWLSWWTQVILTTISAVILIFARNVLSRENSAASVGPGPPFFLTGTGLLVSFASIIWTWGNGRLSRRLTRRPTTRIQAATMLRRVIRVGTTLNLVGLLLHLIAAEQIVGALAIKVLTRPQLTTAASPVWNEVGLQPLDILVVQANTNCLLSHFCSLALLLYLINSVRKLDPPSTEERERQR